MADARYTAAELMQITLMRLDERSLRIVPDAAPLEAWFRSS
jgi:hypothetical protein